MRAALLVERELRALLGDGEKVLGRELVLDLADGSAVDLGSARAGNAGLDNGLARLALAHRGRLDGADGLRHEVVAAVSGLDHLLDAALELLERDLTHHLNLLLVGRLLTLSMIHELSLYC